MYHRYVAALQHNIATVETFAEYNDHYVPTYKFLSPTSEKSVQETVHWNPIGRNFKSDVLEVSPRRTQVDGVQVGRWGQKLTHPLTRVGPHSGGP